MKYLKIKLKWKGPYSVNVKFNIYTGCPGGNVPDFGRLFLKLKYADLTKTPISEVEWLRR